MYNIGDRIRHKKNGGGTIVECPEAHAQNYYVKWDTHRVNRAPQDHTHVSPNSISLIRTQAGGQH